MSVRNSGPARRRCRCRGSSRAVLVSQPMTSARPPCRPPRRAGAPVQIGDVEGEDLAGAGGGLIQQPPQGLLPQRVVGVEEGEQLGRGDGSGAGGRGPGRLPQIQRPRPGREGDRGPAVLRAPDLMRDLQAVWEADPQGQAWAAQMRQTLTKARRAVDAAIDAGASNLPSASLGQLRGLYANTAEQGVAANAPGVKRRQQGGPTSWPNGWPSGSTRCCTSPSTSTSTGPTTAASRPSEWPSSRRRSAGAGGACTGSRPSAASVPTSPPHG